MLKWNLLFQNGISICFYWCFSCHGHHREELHLSLTAYWEYVLTRAAGTSVKPSTERYVRRKRSICILNRATANLPQTPALGKYHVYDVTGSLISNINIHILYNHQKVNWPIGQPHSIYFNLLYSLLFHKGLGASTSAFSSHIQTSASSPF